MSVGVAAEPSGAVNVHPTAPPVAATVMSSLTTTIARCSAPSLGAVHDTIVGVPLTRVNGPTVAACSASVGAWTNGVNPTALPHKMYSAHHGASTSVACPAKYTAPVMLVATTTTRSRGVRTICRCPQVHCPGTE